MRLVPLLAALALAGSADAALPRAGVLVPGRSLGGIELGATAAEVKAIWGSRFGRCRSCSGTTWYFNLRPFQPQGAGVELLNGRVAAVFTLWSPPGWRTTRGLRLGDGSARVTSLYRPVGRFTCSERLTALTVASGTTITAFYVLDEQLWGFGLVRAGVSVCR